MAKVISTIIKDVNKPKPCGLNTVALLRTASKSFGLGAQETMKIAEKLYLDGFITYPRTESTHYSENFEFKEVLKHLTGNAALGTLATLALSVRQKKARVSGVEFYGAGEGAQCRGSSADHACELCVASGLEAGTMEGVRVHLSTLCRDNYAFSCDPASDGQLHGRQ